MLQGKNAVNEAMDGCVRTLMPDVVASKAHQNNCGYVSSADLPSDSLCKNLAWWTVTWRTLKNYKTVKIGGWALALVWALTRDTTIHVPGRIKITSVEATATYPNRQQAMEKAIVNSHTM